MKVENVTTFKYCKKIQNHTENWTELPAGNYELEIDVNRTCIHVKDILQNGCSYLFTMDFKSNGEMSQATCSDKEAGIINKGFIENAGLEITVRH